MTKLAGVENKTGYWTLDSLPKVEVAITHDGPFHADDLLCGYLINKIYPKARLVRTRDEKVIKQGDLVFDVGGTCAVAKLRLDHHLKKGPPRRTDQTPFASIGLFWLVFGEYYCRTIAQQHGVDSMQIAELVMDEFLIPIEAADNSEFFGRVSIGKSQVKKQVTSFNRYLSLFNGHEILDEDLSHDSTEVRFIKAAEVAGEFLENAIRHAAAILLAKSFLNDSYQSGQILVLQKYCEWFRFIYKDQKYSDIRFVVTPYSRESDSWSIQPVRSRAPGLLPKNWAGLDGKDLNEMTGLHGALRCLEHRKNMFVSSSSGSEGMQNAISYANLACDMPFESDDDDFGDVLELDLS